MASYYGRSSPVRLMAPCSPPDQPLPVSSRICSKPAASEVLDSCHCRRDASSGSHALPQVRSDQITLCQGIRAGTCHSPLLPATAALPAAHFDLRFVHLLHLSPAALMLSTLKLTKPRCRVPEDCSAGVADLVRQCMEHTPARRPSAAQVRLASRVWVKGSWRV